MRIVVPGGSGFLGRSFADFATARGHVCQVLTRTPRLENDIEWDGRTQGAWSKAIDGADAVLNLTGRSVDCVHNEANKKEIIESRVNSVRAVGEAVTQSANPPKVIVQAGSLAIFGDTTESCDEDAVHGEDFSAHVCELWEEAFFEKPIVGVRKCMLRIGIVLGPNGGALGPLRKLAQLFLGGTTGKGTQYISWVHVEDFNRMILACIENKGLSGVFNATGPAPATNREFMRSLRRAVGRPWSPPAPTILVRIGARMIMRTDPDLVLTGRNCYPKRFLESGFSFLHPELDHSLKTILADWES